MNYNLRDIGLCYFALVNKKLPNLRLLPDQNLFFYFEMYLQFPESSPILQWEDWVLAFVK